jgi:predicted acylesterase/phospholipase RssA
MGVRWASSSLPAREVDFGLGTRPRALARVTARNQRDVLVAICSRRFRFAANHSSESAIMMTARGTEDGAAVPADATAARFQVLALDGGGVRGIFTAALLAGLEADTGRPVLDHFDLIVGTSNGGIVALGPGAGLTPREILDLYLAERESIYAGPPIWTGVVQGEVPARRGSRRL